MKSEFERRLADVVDCICLVFHEARNVRRVKDRVENSGKYGKLVSLPKNRDDAWLAMRALREESSRASTAKRALAMFEVKYGINIKELRDLYDAPIWKDSHAVGGNKWASITRKVSGLIECYDAGEKERFDVQLKEFMEMRHNTGLVRDKLASLKN